MREDAKDAGDYLANFLEQIVEWLPNFLGALAILVIGYLIAKAVAAAVHNLLGRAQLNQHLHSGQGGSFIQKALPNPQGLVSTVVYWVIFLFAVSIAVSALGIPVLVDFVRAIYSYIPNIIAAFLIFMVAGTVSAGVVTLVTNAMGDTPTGKVVATAAPVVIMSIATFMILNQLQIAPAIVTITYAALLGSAALGLALAFGLGGRDVASQMLQGLYDKSQQSRGQIKSDFQHGANNAKQKGNELKNRNQQ